MANPVKASSSEHRRHHSRLSIAIVAALLTTLLASSPAQAEDEVLWFPTPEDFVVQQYQDFLARDPDGAGLGYWSAQLRAGVNSAELVEVMSESPEFAKVVAPVVRLYSAHFRRPPDSAGLQFWTEKFRSGSSLENISQAFAQSDEFVQTYGSLDDEAFVALVYQNVMGRQSDEEGATFWLSQLKAGLSRGALMVQFSESPEYVTRTNGQVRATMLYVGMLRRTPEAAGLDYWAGLIDGGMPYREAIEGFLLSAEYRVRAEQLFRERHPLTGEATRAVQERPALVLKIDNHNRARPQVGLNQADIVWEELVEGSITRFAAVFHEQSPSVVGPVRSARTGDIDLIAQLNTPLFGASGANRGVLEALETAPLVNVNAIEIGSAYFRDSSRSAPHNLFARTADLWAVAPDRAGQPTMLLRYRAVGAPAVGSPSLGVDVDFGHTDVSYQWNGVGWARTQDGSSHRDGSGILIAPPNLIVQMTEYGVSSADALSPEAITVGNGEALIYTGGNMIEATWSRTRSTNRIVYKDSNGAEVRLTPGRTWVALAPPGSVTQR